MAVRVTSAGTDTVEAGREAVRKNAWREGFELLKAADAQALEPEDLELLADASWWTGRLDECIAARERAFAGYLERDELKPAALAAMLLAKDYYGKLSPAVGSGWLNRAERLLADEPDCLERGYLERLHAVIALEGRGDTAAALEHVDRTIEIAARFGDRDLGALALHDRGRTLVARGEVAEGWALMDEATAAAVAGELTPLTTGFVYCNTISVCEELAEYRRAGEWTEEAKRWCDRQAISGFPGLCRVHRASIMRLRGAWPEAEQEARRACDELREFYISYSAEAFYEIGEIRFRLGDLGAAEEAFVQAHELGRDPQPGLALLRLAQGRLDGACSCIEQALADEARGLHRARFLPAQVKIALAAGDEPKAGAAAEELGAIAQAYGSEALEAHALGAESRVRLAGDDARGALQAARRALRIWQSVDAPYEAAELRLLSAEAHRALGDEENAALEIQAAQSVFQRLGALPAARQAQEALEALGVGAAAHGSEQIRTTRTFMFTDIVRSTSLVEAVGDEAWADLVSWHDRTLRSLFAVSQGEEVDHAGDGFFVAFAAADDAVESAVEIQRTLARHRREHGFAPQVRIGLHAGEATRRAAGYKGRGVHEAARISALAEGGEILASRATVAGTSRFRASDEREVSLKGFDEPVPVVSIDWR